MNNLQASQIFFDDAEVDDEWPVWEVKDLNRMHFVRYAGATGDFNPIHTDETYAKRVGYPSVFGHGMFTAGVLSNYLTSHVGLGNVRKYAFRMHRQIWPGDSLSFRGTVRRKYTEAGEDRLDLEFLVTNHDGETILTSTATAAPPSRRARPEGKGA
jgi:peroxisomal enoyl-CoA hydratase 2